MQAAGPAGLIALLLIVAPQVVILWTVGELKDVEDFSNLMGSRFAIGAGVFGVLTMIASIAGQTALTHLALNVQQRRSASFGDSLANGFRLFLPALGLGILVGLGTALGFLLLIVPGLILMVMWSVALPARIHDGPGVTAAMQTSADLTKGVRWPVFGLMIVAGILLTVISMFGTVPTVWLPPQIVDKVTAILQPLVTGVTTLVTTFGTASLFHELKWGDRDSSEDLTAEVFA